jgi:hypothetical protein
VAGAEEKKRERSFCVVSRTSKLLAGEAIKSSGLLICIERCEDLNRSAMVSLRGRVETFHSNAF